MQENDFDIIIVGTGIAGLSAAIKLSEQKNLKIGLVTREDDPEVTNTFWAQGGIIYPKGNPDLLVEDILRASAYTSNIEAAQMMAKKAAPILEDILLNKVQTDFAKNQNQELRYTKEAAHSESRIIYKGDYTGKSIQQSMVEYLFNKERFPNVHLLSKHTGIDLITPSHHGKTIQARYEDHQVVGMYALDQKNQKIKKLMAKSIILASGGFGSLYLHHSNAEGSRGDGQAMAKRAGAELINMEFVQFHPTTFYDQTSHRRFLISEAVRGEGAILLNAKGEAFMHHYHPDKELAPRDVVTRSILSEMLKHGTHCVYLDLSFKDPEWIKERFPTIYEHTLNKGIDITKVPIPVVPAAHYSLGGIKVNLRGETSIKNLYAVGEVACSGIHGANRLASTSLLEGLTWGYLSAENILQNPLPPLYQREKIKDWETKNISPDQALISQDLLTIKQTMWNYVGPIRSHARLVRAYAMLTELYGEIRNFYHNCALTDDLIGLRNGIDVAIATVNASMKNRESVGCFYLQD